MTKHNRETSIQRTAQFLDDFKVYVLIPQKEAEQKLITKSRDLFSQYRNLMREQKRINLVEAPEFNVFSLTSVMDSELFHSSFLANLLDPNGSHGQGALFMNAFLQMFTNGWSEITQIQGAIENWRVHTEMSTGKGRFDIVAMNHHAGMLFIIENKIYASEQEAQLRRYYDWMKKKRRVMEFPRQMLFFLTPSGYQSATLEEEYYVPMAYHAEIIEWLTITLGKIKAAGVTEIVKQYISAVIRI